MKKFKKVKSLLFGIVLGITFCFANTDVYAKTMTKEEIPSPSYVIGTHVFTREVNEVTGYEGKLTTNLIMLASQTIESNEIDSMIIYYKTASGMWINGLTGEAIEAPESFEIDYTDLQLEEVNNTVTAPKAPILDINGGPLSLNEETGMFYYQLDIYIDDIDDRTNKVDGVELSIVDYNSYITNQDLKYGENFGSTTTVLESYDGDILGIGKQYHRDFISFENTLDGYYTITAKSYVLDDNGKKSYSESVVVSINPDTTLPAVEIVNEYSNPDYMVAEGDYYKYRLGIKMPNAYVYKVSPEKFAYITNCADGTFGIDEKFSVAVAKNTVKSCWAQMGYIDKNGDFKYYYTVNTEENRIYYTIDTRTVTAPILDFEGTQHLDDRWFGEYASINDEFYQSQNEDTLDYQIEGFEIYSVSSISNPKYELVSEGFRGGIFVYPPNGSAYYTARAYATNTEGKRVYSDFSEFIPVVRAPIISASEVKDGKVTVTIENLDEYGSGFEFKLYRYNGEGELETISYTKGEQVSFEISVTESMSIYVKAFDWDFPSTEDVLGSEKSNTVDIVVE